MCRWLLCLFLVGCASGIPQRRGVIPLDMSDPARPWVQASVQGVQRKMLLDSGAHSSVLIEAPSGSGSLQPAGERFNIHGSSRPLGEIDLELQLGDMDKRMARFTIEERIKYEILGLPEFISQRMTFNFEKKQIELGPQQNHCTPQYGFELRRRYIMIPIKRKTGEHLLVWDTGASNSIVDKDWAKRVRLPQNMEKPYRVLNSFGQQGELQNKSYTLEMKFGVSPVKVQAAAGDLKLLQTRLTPKLRGILGYDVIKHFNWTFDFERELFCVEFIEDRIAGP